jgi:hypothetical protein
VLQKEIAGENYFRSMWACGNLPERGKVISIKVRKILNGKNLRSNARQLIERTIN